MAGDTTQNSGSKKSPKTKNRQLIHNSSLKFANHRSGSTSPSQNVAHLPFQIAPNQSINESIEQQLLMPKTANP
jgi:hypothetical protein